MPKISNCSNIGDLEMHNVLNFNDLCLADYQYNNTDKL